MIYRVEGIIEQFGEMFSGALFIIAKVVYFMLTFPLLNHTIQIVERFGSLKK